MALMNDVYSYIENNYQPNEPIFLSELNIPGMKAVSVRQQMKKLTESGQLKRFDTGIYYIPKKSMFRSGSTLSVDEVIRKKYLADGETCCGYVGGILFANQLGLTTQVPGVYEATLQFLDLLKEIVDISEVDGEELTNRLIGYMKKKSIRFESMRPFLPYYPERIYKNMYEVGLLNGVST